MIHIYWIKEGNVRNLFITIADPMMSLREEQKITIHGIILHIASR